MIPALRVRALHKRYRRLTALSDVSLTVRDGEVLGLIGPNGSGKTTLFECLAGVVAADPRSGHWSTDVPIATPSARRPSLLPARRDRALAGADRRLGARLHDRVLRRGPPLDATTVDRAAATRAAARRRRSARCRRASASARCSAIGLLTPQPVLLADEPFDGLDLRQTPRGRRRAARARRGRPHAVPVDPPDQRRGARLRSLRAAERRPRARRGHAATSWPRWPRRRGIADRRTWKRSFLAPHVRPPFGWLLEKEWRELLASRAWWVCWC